MVQFTDLDPRRPWPPVRLYAAIGLALVLIWAGHQDRQPFAQGRPMLMITTFPRLHRWSATAVFVLGSRLPLGRGVRAGARRGGGTAG